MATTVGGGFVYTSIVGPQGLDSVSGSGPPSPVLLPNLVAGWALTSGPQQTLSSAGVISGGAQDMSAAGTVTYGVNGSRVGISQVAGTDVVSKSADSALAITNQAMVLHFLVRAASIPGSVSVIGKQDTLDYEWDVTVQGDGIARFATNSSLDNAYAGAPIVAGSDHYAICISRLADGTMTCYCNGVAGATTSDPTGETDTTAPFYVGGAPDGSTGTPLDGWMLYPRLWIGSNAAVIAANSAWRSWLDNVVAGVASGRTDAEVAAYAG